jgi:S1-C subfamily serine protease
VLAVAISTDQRTRDASARRTWGTRARRTRGARTRDVRAGSAARLGFAWLVACVLACGLAAAQQQQRRPATSAAGGASSAATTNAGGDPAASTTNAATPPSVAQTPNARAARQQQQRPQPQARPSAPVIAVLHKLRGWKLRALVTPPDAPFAATFDDTFVRTNIVAGYVMPDGRTVVARLPRAEAEMLNFSAMFDAPEFPKTREEPALLLVKPNGDQVAARFVGLDGSTGLSLLEAEGPLFAGRVSEVAGRAPAVGQSVRVIAPVPADAAAEDEASPAAVSPDAGVVGDAGVIHMQLGEVRGRLKSVRRSPTGRAASFTVQAERVSPEWAGGVALGEDGGLVGIVEESGARGTTLLSAETVRAAARRVKERRASVPQPWLGARGDSLAGLSPSPLLSRGWPREQAIELLRRQQGVGLTAVAPGTPAARAGLRPGDVVTRIENHEVRGVEDMTWLLDELGSNRAARFTVLRAQSAPLDMQVRLAEAQNPALETAHAEARAAESELRRAESLRLQLDEALRGAGEKIRLLNEAVRAAERARSEGRPGAEASLSQAQNQLKVFQQTLEESTSNYRQALALYESARTGFDEASTRLRAATRPGAALSFRPLLPFGAEAMLYMTTNVVGGRHETERGLAVTAVHAGGAAEAGGLRAGDVIESINGRPPHALDLRDEPAADIGPEPTLAVRRGQKRLTLTLRRATQ